MHSPFWLGPLNPGYQPIFLRYVPEGRIQIIAEFFEVLTEGTGLPPA